MTINREKYDGVHYQVVLMNMTDGTVQGHAAGCRDLTRNKATFAEPSQAKDVWDVEVKEDAREAYNADFDEETDGWYDIEWLPCAKHIPAQHEPTLEEMVADAEAQEPTVWTSGPVVTTKVGRKWAYVYVNGEQVMEVRSHLIDQVLATINFG